jgi:hypothetical protein
MQTNLENELTVDHITGIIQFKRSTPGPNNTLMNKVFFLRNLSKGLQAG